jgi:oligopeptide/dipeptide ABC transporter ATP-binding protein
MQQTPMPTDKSEFFMAMDEKNIVEIRDLRIRFTTPDGEFNAVDGADLDVPAGKTVCLVGESGSGKSVLARAMMRLVAPNATVTGSIQFRSGTGQEQALNNMSPKSREARSIRGHEMGMIFQEPLSALSPVHTIGSQMLESVNNHLKLSKKEAREKCVDMLARVGIPKPEVRIDSYPFEMSGGMRQRAMIAMALVCEPRLLIADEPTTALDVSIQAGILDLIRELQQQMGMAVLFITHDLGVVAQIADSVAVMYLGRLVEQAPVQELFKDPCHPYTAALMRSIPSAAQQRKLPIQAIRGMIPNPFERPGGCTFHTRCDYFQSGKCDTDVPPLQALSEQRKVRCALYGASA